MFVFVGFCVNCYERTARAFWFYVQGFEVNQTKISRCVFLAVVCVVCVVIVVVVVVVVVAAAAAVVACCWLLVGCLFVVCGLLFAAAAAAAAVFCCLLLLLFVVAAAVVHSSRRCACAGRILLHVCPGLCIGFELFCCPCRFGCLRNSFRPFFVDTMSL